MRESAEIREIDASKPGELWRFYRVGTFPGHTPTRQPTAYLRDYNSAWNGCVEYHVRASSGTEAKRAAIKARMADEGVPS